MKIKPQDLRNSHRVNLWEVMPLSTPFLVYFDPSSLCNLRCAFCPTGYTKLRSMRHNGFMDFELFKSIVDQMKAFPEKIKHVTLCKDGEPLLNKHFTDMVRYLKDADIAEKIITKTNGLLLLSHEDNTKLANCGLDQIGISVKHVDLDKYKEITAKYPNYDRLVAMVTDLYNKRGNMQIYVSILDTSLTDAEKQKFFDDFENISDFIAIEDLHGWSMSEMEDFTLGETPKLTPINKKIACPLTMCSMVVNSNGTVSMCGEDWAEETVVGDLNTESVLDVWHGEKMKAFRLMHLEGRRSENKACGNCNYLETLPDNIDQHLDEMKGML